MDLKTSLALYVVVDDFSCYRYLLCCIVVSRALLRKAVTNVLTATPEMMTRRGGHKETDLQQIEEFCCLSGSLHHTAKPDAEVLYRNDRKGPHIGIINKATPQSLDTCHGPLLPKIHHSSSHPRNIYQWPYNGSPRDARSLGSCIHKE